MHVGKINTKIIHDIQWSIESVLFLEIVSLDDVEDTGRT